MMGACFGTVVRTFDEVAGEFYAVHRLGLSFEDWRRMPRWLITDFRARALVERRSREQGLKGKSWKEVLGAVIGRVLGIG